MFLWVFDVVRLIKMDVVGIFYMTVIIILLLLLLLLQAKEYIVPGIVLGVVIWLLI